MPGHYTMWTRTLNLILRASRSEHIPSVLTVDKMSLDRLEITPAPRERNWPGPVPAKKVRIAPAHVVGPGPVREPGTEANPVPGKVRRIRASPGPGEGPGAGEGPVPGEVRETGAILGRNLGPGPGGELGTEEFHGPGPGSGRDPVTGEAQKEQVPGPAKVGTPETGKILKEVTPFPERFRRPE